MEPTHRMVFIPADSMVNDRMVIEFADLFGFIDIKKLRRKLRLYTMTFVMKEIENLPEDTPEFLEELNIFFDFLDIMEDELDKQKNKCMK